MPHLADHRADGLAPQRPEASWILRYHSGTWLPPGGPEYFYRSRECQGATLGFEIDPAFEPLAPSHGAIFIREQQGGMPCAEVRLKSIFLAASNGF